jgi:REP element-mobilizing transposase RayT
VTFRLGDSLPQGKLRQLMAIRRDWEQGHPPPRQRAELEEFAREMFERVERWLDQGYGECHLKDPQLAAFIVEAMHHFDGSRYELGAYVVMPNHVHTIVRPENPGEDALEMILKSWKQFSARKINLARDGGGDLWQQESHDRIIRDEEHLWRCLPYIGRNAAKAGLASESCPRWVRAEWEQLGWRFE